MTINHQDQPILTLSGDFSPALESLTHEKFQQKIASHFHKITKAHFIFKVEKLTHTIEIELHIAGHIFFSKATEEDMYKSLDKAIDKMVTQLKKYKDQHQDHK